MGDAYQSGSTRPELHLRNDLLVPDLAGWRRERLPAIPETAWFEQESRSNPRGPVTIRRSALSGFRLIRYGLEPALIHPRFRLKSPMVSWVWVALGS